MSWNLDAQTNVSFLSQATFFGMEKYFLHFPVFYHFLHSDTCLYFLILTLSKIDTLLILDKPS